MTIGAYNDVTTNDSRWVAGYDASTGHVSIHKRSSSDDDLISYLHTRQDRAATAYEAALPYDDTAVGSGSCIVAYE